MLKTTLKSTSIQKKTARLHNVSKCSLLSTSAIHRHKYNLTMWETLRCVCWSWPTWERCHSPAAWRRPVRTRVNWRCQSHWEDREASEDLWSRPVPRGSIHKDWTDWPGTGPRSPQYRQTQYTSRSHRPAGPGRRKRRAWTFAASLS